MKINYGQLEKAGWKAPDTGAFYKDGFAIWFWDKWTLEISPKKASERPTIIKSGIKTMEELKQYTSKNIPSQTTN